MTANERRELEAAGEIQTRDGGKDVLPEKESVPSVVADNQDTKPNSALPGVTETEYQKRRRERQKEQNMSMEQHGGGGGLPPHINGGVAKTLPPPAPSPTPQRSVWWFVAILAGIAVVIGLLLYQQFNDDDSVDKIASAVTKDGDVTRALLGVDGPIVSTMRIDGEETRRLVGGTDTETYRLLKKFQGWVVTDPAEVLAYEKLLDECVKSGKTPSECCHLSKPQNGMLNMLFGLTEKGLVQSEKNGRAINRVNKKLDEHDRRLRSHEEADKKRSEETRGYLLSLEAKYGNLSVGVDDLRKRADKPVNVRVVVPRTKTVAVER